MSPFAPLACLLAYLEDGLCCLVQDLLGFAPPRDVGPLLSAAGLTGGWQAAPAGATPPRYVVRYQLTGAELREGRVVASYVAPCVRLFDTDELNVIWAELLDELGTSPYRLGLEIQAIDAYPRWHNPLVRRVGAGCGRAPGRKAQWYYFLLIPFYAAAHVPLH